MSSVRTGIVAGEAGSEGVGALRVTAAKLQSAAGLSAPLLLTFGHRLTALARRRDLETKTVYLRTQPHFVHKAEMKSYLVS